MDFTSVKKQIEFVGIMIAFTLAILFCIFLFIGCFFDADHILRISMNEMGEAAWEGHLFIVVLVLLLFSIREYILSVKTARDLTPKCKDAAGGICNK